MALGRRVSTMKSFLAAVRRSSVVQVYVTPRAWSCKKPMTNDKQSQVGPRRPANPFFNSQWQLWRRRCTCSGRQSDNRCWRQGESSPHLQSRSPGWLRRLLADSLLHVGNTVINANGVKNNNESLANLREEEELTSPVHVLLQGSPGRLKRHDLFLEYHVEYNGAHVRQLNELEARAK